MRASAFGEDELGDGLGGFQRPAGRAHLSCVDQGRVRQRQSMIERRAVSAALPDIT